MQRDRTNYAVCATLVATANVESARLKRGYTCASGVRKHAHWQVHRLSERQPRGRRPIYWKARMSEKIIAFLVHFVTHVIDRGRLCRHCCADGD